MYDMFKFLLLLWLHAFTKNLLPFEEPWISTWQLLCIPTSEQVLRMPFAGRNHIFDAKTTFSVYLCHKMFKKCKKTHVLKGVYQGLDVNLKSWFAACFCAAFLFFFLFSVSDGKIQKTYFTAKTNDFNLRTACGAPVCWSKYTTGSVFCVRWPLF